MSDHRSVPRNRELLGARIIFDNDSSTLDCIVRDLSAGGAKLVFGSPDGIPYLFTLQIPAHGSQHEAQLVWRQGGTCGVKFIG
jgi:PilZ domain-containing protein